MTPEIKLKGIPEEFQLLYTTISAREVISKASEIIRSANPEKQRDLLLTPTFSNIVISALVNLDEHRPSFENELITTFHKDNQLLATHVLSESED